MYDFIKISDLKIDRASRNNFIYEVYNYFEKENIKFISLDDIQDNPEKVYSETLSFLNIDSNINISDFKVLNKNKNYKSKFIRNFIKKYSIGLGKLRSKFMGKPLGIIRSIESLNKKEENRNE